MVVNGTHRCSAFLSIEWQQFFYCCVVPAQKGTLMDTGGGVCLYFEQGNATICYNGCVSMHLLICCN